MEGPCENEVQPDEEKGAATTLANWKALGTGPELQNPGLQADYPKRSNCQVIQRRQNVILRMIVNACRFSRNDDIHADLSIPYVDEVREYYVDAHEKRLHSHINTEAIQLLHPVLSV